MFANWLLISVSISYIGLLFLIAYLGGKYRHKIAGKQHAIIYALSLGVYCTSWGFLGTAAQAANRNFTYFSVYLAPILLFVFAWPFIQRIIKTCLALKITSIADLLSSRFGKSQSLGVMITLVALIGVVPYIALQLKAIVYSYQILQEDTDFSVWQVALFVSLILAWFTVIFGIRTIDVTERHPGVMVAIAFESIVKLVAFLGIGLFVSFVIYDSPIDIWELSMEQMFVDYQFEPSNLLNMFGLMIIAVSAFLCMPRQFQVMFVEIKEQKNSAFARWLLPIYVIIFAVFAVPIGLAGSLNYGSSLPTDAYVLYLPAYNGQMWMSLFAFLGAVSAASSMVIVSTIALSTMLSNEIVFPMIFKFSRKQNYDFNQFQSRLLLIRKALVLFVILLSYGMLLLSPPDTLSSLGEVAFGAIAQIGPALFAAFLWRKTTLYGVLAGISSGFSVWCVFNLLPQLGFYSHPLSGSGLPATTVITLIGLFLNITMLWVVSLLTRQSIREQMQAKFFYKERVKEQWNLPIKSKIDVTELELLIARFIGQEKARICFQLFNQKYGQPSINAKNNKKFNEDLILHVEDTLARVIGSASAKLVTSFATGIRKIDFEEVAKLVEDNSTEQLEFSRTVLQSAIENVSEGISVIDGDLNLVAWNKQYLDIFNYPDNFVYIGCPISQLIRFNLMQQKHFSNDLDKQVKKRIKYMKVGSRHSTERKLKNGKTIHIEGNPIPGGGFVMIFSDITIYRQAEKVLKEENYDLESRVRYRTAELELANKKLEQAREKSEQANIQKSQYLKACSHDLLQPLSAARLFCSSVLLSSKAHRVDREQIKQIDNSLEIANNLLLDLNEIARIESGNISPTIEVLSVNKLFSMLSSEFSGLTEEYKIQFRCITTQYYIKSDITLLSRIIQNFLSNAFRYANNGKVLLGCRKQGDELSIQVFDNGPGIPIDKQQQVFEQFMQLKTSNVIGPKGLGLGLNIARSLAEILGHKINLKSEVDKGCLFSVNVPLDESSVLVKPKQNSSASMNLQGVGVLCIDNEKDILLGMEHLLDAWQCKVFLATDAQQAREILLKHEDEIDMLLVDYQLDVPTGGLEAIISQEGICNLYDVNGIELIQQLREMSQYPLPAILITATTDENLINRAQQVDIGYLRKMIKPIALRSLMSSLLAKKLEQNYANWSSKE
ncbi:hybrid sensor histidine kinase/response regulator [Pseudocolwellia agarivorans]|uniref:hybrid sensor histidine kinase/response regulator n=1 Tax=Pseudocolwellia agarivorans TaxID=1911682 RepID=UPI00098627F5|nr:PAS-domain containing protein [Pseudocolwellia agarivorans]